MRTSKVENERDNNDDDVAVTTVPVEICEIQNTKLECILTAGLDLGNLVRQGYDTVGWW